MSLSPRFSIRATAGLNGLVKKGCKALALCLTASALLSQSPVQAQGRPIGQAGSIQLNAAIQAFNAYYGGTVFALDSTYLIDIPDEETRQTALLYLVLNAYYPTGTMNDPTSLVPDTPSNDPALTLDDFAAVYLELSGMISVGDSVSEVRYFSADIGAFSNFVIHDNNGIIFAPILSNVHAPSASSASFTDDDEDEDLSTFSDNTTYLWGSPAETFDASVTAICDDGRLENCVMDCNAHSGALASAEIGCKAIEANGECCKISYEYAWATGFKNVKLSVDGTSVEVTGYIGQSGGGNGTLLDCCLDMNGTIGS